MSRIALNIQHNGRVQIKNVDLNEVQLKHKVSAADTNSAKQRQNLEHVATRPCLI
jgi:hypothetical protein